MNNVIITTSYPKTVDFSKPNNYKVAKHYLITDSNCSGRFSEKDLENGNFRLEISWNTKLSPKSSPTSNKPYNRFYYQPEDLLHWSNVLIDFYSVKCKIKEITYKQLCPTQFPQLKLKIISML